MDAVMRQHGPRPVAEVLQRTRQLADAIDCAASAGVHHGMMAPCDVILDGDRTGVTGCGLAQALIKAGIPAEGGAPYGSPQRLAGAPPTRADDVYALAAITLELLIGTPRDPEQDTSRALREAQGLPERRRVPRPAPHETRVFTTIAGVDAGKLRAAFAAAFSDEPGDRPSTGAEFVARFEDAFATRRVTDEPAPSVVTVPTPSVEAASAPSVEAVPAESAEREEPPSPPVSDTKPEESAAALEPPVRQERPEGNSRAARRRRARERRRERQATSQPQVRESHDQEPQERQPETRLVRSIPIEDAVFVPEVLPSPRAISIHEASYRTAVQPGARALLVAAAVAFSFGAGFGGGFIVGQHSTPATESTNISHPQPAPEPPPTRAAVEDPQPIASTTQAVAPIPAPVEPQPTRPAVQSGRLSVRSTPAGADVVVDGQSRGVTPLDLRELAFGTHTIAVSRPDHDSRQQRVTLSERRPARTVNVTLRPTSVPAQATAATSATGSLQIASRPSGAQVFVDDNLIGTTPLLLSNVEAGPRLVRIELSGYRIWTSSVRIEPSARFRVSARLEP